MGRAVIVDSRPVDRSWVILKAGLLELVGGLDLADGEAPEALDAALHVNLLLDVAVEEVVGVVSRLVLVATVVVRLDGGQHGVLRGDTDVLLEVFFGSWNGVETACCGKG